MVVNLKLVGYISKRVVRIGWIFIGLVVAQYGMSLSGMAGAGIPGGSTTIPQSARISQSATIPPLLTEPGAVQPHSVD
jgi:hypothetical protein